MNQKEIKIPLTCGVFGRLIALVMSGLWIGGLFFIASENNTLTIFSGLMIIMFPTFLWGVFEFVSYATKKVVNDEPVFPFKFSCRCEND